MAEEKTNVMRVLDQKKVPYTPHYYDASGGAVDGRSVATQLGQDTARVCKTLVTQGSSGRYCVFVIPVAGELDLKAAAKAAGEKSVEMIKQAQLLPLTGYIHGGCSPVGMKKLFPTFIDESVQNMPTITVSAGKIGFQVELSPADLCKLVRGRFAPVSKHL